MPEGNKKIYLLIFPDGSNTLFWYITWDNLEKGHFSNEKIGSNYIKGKLLDFVIIRMAASPILCNAVLCRLLLGVPKRNPGFSTEINLKDFSNKYFPIIRIFEKYRYIHINNISVLPLKINIVNVCITEKYDVKKFDIPHPFCKRNILTKKLILSGYSF